MSIVINIILIIISLVLIIAVLMQEGNKQGLGAIGGAAETFMGKNKSKSYEGKLLKITKIGAAVFVVIAILATWLNARTYTVKYFDHEGNEYFPLVEMQAEVSTMFGTATDYDTLNASLDYDQKVVKYKYGDEIDDYDTPVREGYVGKWDKELPETMGRTNYTLNALYEIGTYTLSFKNGTIDVPVEITPATSGEATVGEATPSVAVPEMLPEVQEPVDLGTYTDVYMQPIDMTKIPELPVIEGYTSDWDKAIPETMPGVDTTFTVIYTPITDEPVDEPTEETTEETTEEPVEEPTDEPTEEPVGAATASEPVTTEE